MTGQEIVDKGIVDVRFPPAQSQGIRFFVWADGPDVSLDGGVFHDRVEIIVQPTYGRVLFTQPKITIRNCTFYG